MHLASTYASEITKHVDRWDNKSKTHVSVPVPEAMVEYNSSMGGADLANMFISLYRTPYKGKRWYLRVLFHCVDISKVNAWVFYRRHCWQLDVPVKKQMKQLNFIQSIIESLLKEGKCCEPRPVGRPSLLSLLDATTTKGRKPVVPTPTRSVSADEFSYWPDMVEKKGKCRYCKVGIIRVMCTK